MNNKKTVIVGMSGGVDSSVSALLLKQQGYHVIGLFMKNWEEKDSQGVCQSSEDYEDVKRVCDQIGIPYYSVNFVKEYWDSVFEEFLEGLKKGDTPNPDILCNREIKFKHFFQKAMELGGDYLATGHYCRVGESFQLMKGLDPNKDQSYFLHAIDGSVLNRVLFPIGGIPKSEVRKIAKENGLSTSEKKDSTGICFIGKRDFKPFVSRYIQYQPGEFMTSEGQCVGKHDGAAFYTIGQRRGLGIGGPGEPWFVVGKDMAKNIVFVEQGENHPALFSKELTAKEATWIQGAPTTPFRCKAKVRYRQEDQDCVITKIEDGEIHVIFDQPQRAVTPMQSVVFYDGELCLGGGLIKEAIN